MIRRILFTILSLFALVYAGLVVYAYWPYPDGVPARNLAGPADRFVEVDGIPIRYQTWGEPAEGQPAIVLIHGFANAVTTYRLVGPLLGEEYQVFAIDMPGFGLSGKPTDHNYDNASQADIAEGFIRAMGLEKVVVGGHSMGGAHTVHVAIDAPEVVGAILLNPGIITTGVPAATEYFVFPLPRLAAKIFADRDFRGRFIRNSFLRPEIITEDVMDELMLAGQTDDYIAGATHMMGFYAAGNEIEMLDELDVPVLIVWGVDDKSKPKDEADNLDAMIPKSKLVRIENAAHYVHEEKPRETADAIIAAKDFWASSG
jgi:pimeloyl-ACP methyl ester carboxylesterase